MPDPYRAVRNGSWTRGGSGRTVEVPARTIRVRIGAGTPRHQRTFIMRVFVTGATGFIGSAVVRNCSARGTRSSASPGRTRPPRRWRRPGPRCSAAPLRTPTGCGAARPRRRRDPHRVHPRLLPHRQPGGGRRGGRGAIAAFGEALAGTGKPLVVAAGLPAPEPGGRHRRRRAPENPRYPRVSERAAIALAGRGVRVSVVRLPPSVHGEGDPPSSPRSSASPGRRACPPTSATAPTCGPRCTGSTPRGCSGSPWSRRPPGRC